MAFFMFQSVSAPFVTPKVHHFHHVPSLFFPLPQQTDPTFGEYLKKNATFHGSWESAKICSGHGRAGLHSNGKNHYLLNRKNTSSSLVHFFI